MGWPFWVTDPFLSIFFGSAEFSEVKSNHLKNYCIAFLQPSIYNGKQECKDYCLFQKFSWYDFAIIIGVAVLLTSTNSLLILIIGINLSVFLTSWASNKILFLSLNWTYCKTGEFFYILYTEIVSVRCVKTLKTLCWERTSVLCNEIPRDQNISTD